MSENDPKPRIQSVARAINLLSAIAQSPAGLTVNEMGEQLGLNRQTVYHMLHTLSAEGVVAKHDVNRYVLGIRIGTLAEGFRRHLAPPEHFGPCLRDIANETGQVAYVAGWWDGAVTILGVARGMGAVQAGAVPHGLAADPHARASGKLLLAYAAPHIRAGVLDGTGPLRARTPNTITSRQRLEEDFATIRERGYSTDLEEYEVGLSCIAVPLDSGASPFALCVSAPTSIFNEAWPDYLTILQNAAKAVG